MANIDDEPFAAIAESLRGRPEAFALICCDASDRDLAENTQAALRRLGVDARLPPPGGTAAASRADLEEAMTRCEALVIAFDRAPVAWVRGQLRLHAKLRRGRSTPLQHLAIYSPRAGAARIAAERQDPPRPP